MLSMGVPQLGWVSDLDLDLKIDLVIAYELDLLGKVILFFVSELDLFIKIKEMVILNNLDIQYGARLVEKVSSSMNKIHTT